MKDPEDEEGTPSQEEEEPTFCGNRGRRCKNIFGHCDYHTDMGDALYHERVDKKLERGE